MTGQRTLDWRFFVALMATLMVAYLVVGGYQDNVEKGHRIDRLIAAAEAQDQATAKAAADASAERQALLVNQRRLLRQAAHTQDRLHALEDRQARLLAYLEDLGIQVPPEFQEASRSRPPKRPAESAENPKAGNGPPPKGPATLGNLDQGGLISDLLGGLLRGLLGILHPERNTP